MSKCQSYPSLGTQPFPRNPVVSSLPTLILALVLFFSFTLPSLGGFIYFFADDAYYLKLGKEQSIFESLLQPGLSGWFRPFLSMPWVVGWSLWGRSTWGYQTLISILVVATTFVLYQIGKQLSGKKAGIIASAFFVTYLPMIHSTWWKCSNGYAFEWLFTTLAIHFFIRYHRTRGCLSLMAVFLSGIFANFSRQSAIILFLILFSYSFFRLIEKKGVMKTVTDLSTKRGQKSFWKQEAKTFTAPLFLGFLVLFLYLLIEKAVLKLQLAYVGFHPPLALQHLAVLFGIQGLFGNAPFIGAAAWSCLSKKGGPNHGVFQKTVVPAVLGVFAGFSAACVILRIGSTDLLYVGRAAIGSTFLAFLILSASFFVVDANKRFAISWAILALIPNMFSALVGYAYTVVSALGLFLFLGLAFSETQFNLKANPKIPLLMLAVLLLGTVLKIQDIPITLEYFKYRVATGENERKVIHYLSQHAPMHQVIYGDREKPWSVKVSFMGKTYELGGTVGDPSYTFWMLSVCERSDLTVKSIGDLKKEPPSVETFAYLYDEGNLETISSLINGYDMSVAKQYEMWGDRALILAVRPRGKGSDP